MVVRKGKAAALDKVTNPGPATPSFLVNGHAPSPAEVPATCAMLGEVRTELLQRMDGMEQRVTARFHGLEARMHGLEGRFHSVEAEIHDVKANVARIGFLIEEQNARNKVALDALAAFIDRQGRLEQRMDGVEQTVRGLASARPRV